MQPLGSGCQRRADAADGLFQAAGTEGEPLMPSASAADKVLTELQKEDASLVSVADEEGSSAKSNNVSKLALRDGADAH
ncbi:hypothetical protein NDU88_003156 [Pleurodeles waltl]|uniref:Uncharacterized protein n=1 Tax=Pleurodeles waltl TaxID=8319 RepID=A0AAV7MPS1_PLEWA|nr:hypothetical protein NDU88_003156 [Pleurodeles waltl]